MASKRDAIASGLGAGLLLSLVVGIFLGIRGQVAGVSLVDQLAPALQRLALIVSGDTAQLRLLGLVCVACGVLVILDRRRRAKVREATC